MIKVLEIYWNLIDIYKLVDMRTLAFLNGECLGFEATNQDTVKHESEPILNRN